LLIGIMQASALIPGVSRSGITIITGMSLKLKREAAARFSFLMAIPAIFGAGIKKGLDMVNTSFASAEIIIFAIGFFASFIVSYLAIRWLLKYLQKHSLHIFAYYRVVLALIILLLKVIS